MSLSTFGGPVEIELINNEIIVTSSSFRDKDLIKLVPGTKWHAEMSRWRCQLSWPACHAFRGVFGDRLQIGPELTAWAAGELDRWVAPAQQLRAASDCDGDERQDPHQRVGTAFLKLVRHALVADEMRTGKTVQAAVALRDLYAIDPPGPVLIICPNGARRVWLRHIEDWAPKIRAEMVGGGAANRRKTFARLDAGEIDCVIINWEAVRLHSRLAPYGSIHLSDKEREPGDLNRHWGVVIADEVHRAKDPRAKQTRALWAAAADAEYRWGFTGTPIANNAGDLWAILHFLNPTEFPSKSRYIDRYCMQTWNPFGGLQVTGFNPATEAELRKTLDVRMIRTTQREAWGDAYLEPERSVWEVELKPKELKAYRQMRDELLAELDQGAQVVGWNPLTRMTRLLQLASGSLVANDDGSFSLAEPSSKLDAFDDLLIDLDGQQLVVASPSRQLLQLLAARLERRKMLFGAIHGQINVDQRDTYIDLFQDGRLQVMLLQTKAGGEGIALHAADTMVFLNRPMSLVENEQAEARTAHRSKRVRRHVIDLVTLDTVEERVFALLSEKGERLEEVLRDRDRLRDMLI